MFAPHWLDDGIQVFAKYNPSPEEYKQHLIKTLETEPDLIIDDGGDLVSILHSERPDLLENVLGGCEETTTGILRLSRWKKRVTLKFPMVAVNDAFSKYFLITVTEPVNLSGTESTGQRTSLLPGKPLSSSVTDGAAKGWPCEPKDWVPK